MDDKIKAKAQEVRLALLGELATEVGRIRSSVSPERINEELHALTGILNQLDPGLGIASYSASAIDPREVGGVGGYATK